MFTFSLFMIREIVWFVLVSIQDGIKDYANARKRTHYGVSVAIYAAEITVLFAEIHTVIFHVTFVTAISAWEWIVIQIAE